LLSFARLAHGLGSVIRTKLPEANEDRASVLRGGYMRSTWRVADIRASRIVAMFVLKNAVADAKSKLDRRGRREASLRAGLRLKSPLRAATPGATTALASFSNPIRPPKAVIRVSAVAFRRSSKTGPLATTIHLNLAAVDLRHPERIGQLRSDSAGENRSSLHRERRRVYVGA